MPCISVLMPAYNAEKYIDKSIESVLNQTFKDFELIIINDGSSDSTEKIIKSFQDNRIQYIYHNNQGLSKTLNIGLSIAKGKYIARLDADDLNYIDRLRKQYEFMEANASYVVCGSYADVIDEHGEFIYTFSEIPNLNYEIQVEMEKRNCIVHSSSFYRREYALLVGGYYEPIKQYFEDYMFFFQLIKKGNAYNFPESLIQYRISPGSISTRDKNKRYDNLVQNVVHRGYITDEEKEYLFTYKSKIGNAHLKLSNHYLALARLTLIHQKNLRKTLAFFKKAVLSNPLNINIILSGTYMVFTYFINKFK